MAPTKALKKNYRCDRSLQQFYTGGPFAVGCSPAGDGEGEGGAETEPFLACACGGEVRVVSTADATAIVLIGQPVDGDSEEAITALALSSDSCFLFAAGHSRRHSRLIRVWDLATRNCIRSWKGHDGPIMAMACHAYGGLLATAGADKVVRLWDVKSELCTHCLRGHTGTATTIMFHKDPEQLFLFSGSEDGTVRVWNLITKNCVAVLKKHISTVTSLALSDDGQTLLSAGRDKVVIAWDVPKYSLKKTIPINEMIEAVCFIGSGSELLACLGIELANMKGKTDDYFLTVGECGVVCIWRLESGQCIFKQQSSDVTVNSENEETRRGFTSAVMLPNDQGLLCVTGDRQFLFYCPQKTDEGSFQLSLFKRLVGYNDEILDLKFVGDEEQYLAVATNLEQVRVYDVASMSCSYVLAGHTEIVTCVDTCVSSSGKTLIVTGSKDTNVRLWDAERRSCIGTGKGHLGAVGCVAFSKKSKNFFLSGSSDRTIKVWTWDDTLGNADDEVPLRAKAVVAAHEKDINSLAVSPNDGLVCSGSEDRSACIWKLPNLVSSVVLKGHRRGIWSVEFSPVEQYVMTASGDRTIKIWSVTNGSCLKTFEGHASSVLRTSFLSRGTQVISCGSDGLVKLWTMDTNECTATYKHDGKVWALAVGRKTEMLATGGTDAILNLWHDCTMEDNQEDFCKKSKKKIIWDSNTTEKFCVCCVEMMKPNVMDATNLTKEQLQVISQQMTHEGHSSFTTAQLAHRLTKLRRFYEVYLNSQEGLCNKKFWENIAKNERYKEMKMIRNGEELPHKNLLKMMFCSMPEEIKWQIRAKKTKLQAQFSDMRPVAMAPSVGPRMPMFPPGVPGVGQQLFRGQPPPASINPQEEFSQMRPIAMAPSVGPRMPMFPPGVPGVGQQLFRGQPPPASINPQEISHRQREIELLEAQLEAQLVAVEEKLKLSVAETLENTKKCKEGQQLIAKRQSSLEDDQEKIRKWNGWRLKQIFEIVERRKRMTVHTPQQQPRKFTHESSCKRGREPLSMIMEYCTPKRTHKAVRSHDGGGSMTRVQAGAGTSHYKRPCDLPPILESDCPLKKKCKEMRTHGLGANQSRAQLTASRYRSSTNKAMRTSNSIKRARARRNEVAQFHLIIPLEV